MAKILIAEDEQEIIQFCSMVLEKAGHKIIAVNDGLEALEKLGSEKPDLIILDIMLPGLDGYSLELQISQDRLLSGVPVIIISALRPAKELFGKFAQVVAFLPKPFIANDLLKAVTSGLETVRPGKN